MKRILAFLLAVIMVVFACSCSVKNTETKKNDSADNSSVASDSEPETMPLVIARELFDRNLKCTLEIFDLNTLAFEDEAVEGTFCPVTDSRFKTFADLEEYVNATYVKDIADNLLIERGLYKEVNGVFCIDTSRIGGKGYYVDWSDYDLEIVSGDKDTCEFDVKGYIEEPSNDPQREPYTKTAKAKNVDGNWLLEAVVY